MTAPTPFRTGIWLFSDAPAGELVEAIELADRAGVDEVWVADEGVSREPVPVLAYAAARTERVSLGVGITSPLLRHPGALGSTISTLDEISGGRAMLGLGIGGNLSRDPFSITFERPVGIMRDALRVTRAVVERQACDGYEPPSHASPARTVPIYVGARGEQMNRLASRAADGVFLSGFDLSQLAAPVAWARSERPVHVALYASVRTEPRVPDDPTALAGPPREVAARLGDLIAAHRPETIGLALVDGQPPVGMMRRAIDVFEQLR